MWTKVDKPLSYYIAIDSGMIPDIDKGLYFASVIYKGYGDDYGLSIISVEGKYIISDKIGCDLSFNSNIPDYESGVGNYSLDLSIRPSTGGTIYKSNSGHYCKIASSALGVYALYMGKYLIDNDPIEDQFRYGRDGVLMTTERIFNFGAYKESNGVPLYKWDDRANVLSGDGGYVNFLTLSGENKGEIEAASELAFIENDYFVQYDSINNWNGWYSDELTGVYNSFGGAGGQKKVGFYHYSDSEGNRYTKHIDLIEVDDKWSTVSKINGKTYTTSTEPQDLNVTLSNPDATPTTLSLTFIDYIQADKKEMHIVHGVNAR